MRQPISRGKHLYILFVLFVLCAIIYYFGELVNVLGWETLRWPIWYTVHDPHRILFLIPILYCTYYFSFRGALISNSISLLIFLPRALFISPYPDATLRMIIFVISSTLLSTLMALLLTNRDKRYESRERVRPVTKSYPKVPFTLLLIFIFMSAGILTAGYLFYNDYGEKYRMQVDQQLSAIADLKAGEIVQWRKERIGDGNMLFRNPAFSNLVQSYLEHPADVQSRERVGSWLSHYLQYGQYEKIILLDAGGVSRIVTPDTPEPIPSHISQDAFRVMQSGKLTVLDLAHDDDTTLPHMVILVPIFSEKEDNVPLGVVAMLIDPYRYLYPLISRWPTPSKTAETLIVRQDGNDALYLNELKFQKDTALKLRIPLEQNDVPAVKAVMGQEGIVEGRDYRGENVIADISHVPDSPWFMVARIDTSEVYAPLTQVLWLIIALVGALLVGAGSGMALIWRLQNIRVYKERAEITDALKVSEERYRLIIDYSLDMIYTLDADGKFLFVSPASQRIMGYDPSEMLGRTIRSYIHPDDVPVVENALMDFLQTGQFTPGLEYRVKHSSGDWRWHTTSGNRVLDETGSFLYFVGIAHDITERKKLEKALGDELLRRRILVEQSRDGIVILDQNGKVYESNRQFAAMLGYTLEEVSQLYVYDWEYQIPQEKVLEMIRRVDETGDHFVTQHRRKDGTTYDVEISTNAATIEDQKLIFCVCRDITERKLAEENLLKSYESVKKTLNDAINTMVKIVETRDPYTAGHQQNVAALATAIAREMKLEEGQIDKIRMAAVIHDIGKMYIPSDILSKPGRLSDIEFSLIKTHPQSGYDIVSGMDFHASVAQAILQHHERLDGSGYPVGLKSEDTLLEAKILAVADVIEAMAADRPYRAALGIDKALEEISLNRGRLYDPVVVDACLEIFNKGRFQFKPV